MKKLFVLGAFIAALCLFSACKTTSVAETTNAPLEDFYEFSMNEDLSWLYGTWELVKWETDNHGKWEDCTHIYEYQFLEISGKTKDSTLIEESKSSKTGKIHKYEYTVEKYFTMNNHAKGHFNKVNEEKTTLLLRREFAMDGNVLFYYTFKKK